MGVAFAILVSGSGVRPSFHVMFGMVHLRMIDRRGSGGWLGGHVMTGVLGNGGRCNSKQCGAGEETESHGKGHLFKVSG